MIPRTARALRALAAATAGALLAAITVWAHVIWINGTALTTSSYPMSSEPLTRLTLLRDTGLPSLALIPLLWVLALLSGPWPLRFFSALLFLAGWYWLADGIANLFALHFGNTWATGEAFDALFYHPVATPALMGLSLLAYMVLLSRLNRA